MGPLHQAIAEHRGDAPVVIHVESAESIDDIALHEGFSVEPGPGLERTVEALLGPGAYRLETRRERAPERETWGAGRRGSRARRPASKSARPTKYSTRKIRNAMAAPPSMAAPRGTMPGERSHQRVGEAADHQHDAGARGWRGTARTAA